MCIRDRSLSPRVKWEHLADYEFELPPLEEQKILADKLLSLIHICGSSQNMMYGLFLDSTAPLYGRADEIMKLSLIHI